MPAYITVRTNSITAQIKVPGTWKAIGRQGIIINKSLDSFAVQTINKGFEYSWNEGTLRSGKYTLTLLFRRLNIGKEFKINIKINPDRADNAAVPITKEIMLPSADTSALYLIPLEVTLPESGKIFLGIQPEKGHKIVLSGLILSFKFHDNL